MGLINGGLSPIRAIFSLVIHGVTFSLNFSSRVSMYSVCSADEMEAFVHGFGEVHSKLLSKCVGSPDGCLLWRGGRSNSGYGATRVKVFTNGGHVHSSVMLVHRVSFQCAHRKILSSEDHLSHLCHHKLCCNTDHLVLEPIEINNQRKWCKRNGSCCGHHLPACMFLTKE